MYRSASECRIERRARRLKTRHVLALLGRVVRLIPLPASLRKALGSVNRSAQAFCDEKHLIDSSGALLFAFPLSWEDNKIWSALCLANHSSAPFNTSNCIDLETPADLALVDESGNLFWSFGNKKWLLSEIKLAVLFANKALRERGVAA